MSYKKLIKFQFYDVDEGRKETLQMNFDMLASHLNCFFRPERQNEGDNEEKRDFLVPFFEAQNENFESLYCFLHHRQ